MQIIGTILILLAFVISYYYFTDKKKKQNVLDREAKERFWAYLRNMQVKKGQLKIVLASGDDNSEISVADAIKKISLSKNTRIKRYGQN